MVRQASGDLLADALLHCTAIPVIINFHGITEIQPHAMNRVAEFIRHGGRTLIALAPARLRDQLEKQLGLATDACHDVETGHVQTYGRSLGNRAQVLSLVGKAAIAEREHLEAIVRRSFHEYEKEQRLVSTAVLATGVFDAGQIVANRDSFAWVSVLMGDLFDRECAKIEEAGRANEIPNTLLAVSLRASPFAGALAQLVARQPSLDIVDHLGPKIRLSSEHAFNDQSGASRYVYVGDFIVGGTELKIAQQYARSRGGEVVMAIVIGGWMTAETYSELAEIPVLSLVHLAELKTNAKFRLFGEDPVTIPSVGAVP